MNRHPFEAAQRGRTEFWESLRDKNLAEHDKTTAQITLFRPIDALRKQRELRRIRRFLTRAAVIIDESRNHDKEIADFHDTESERQSTRHITIIPEPGFIAARQPETSAFDTTF